jgi:putative membrane protein
MTGLLQLGDGPSVCRGKAQDAARGRYGIVTDLTDKPERTRLDLAEDRTILANERTFAGWVRTALACIALGVGFHALFQSIRPPWLPRVVATAFLLLAIFLVVLAERRAAAVMRRLSAHVVLTARPMNLRIFAAVIVLGAAALIVAIWLVEIG